MKKYIILIIIFVLLIISSHHYSYTAEPKKAIELIKYMATETRDPFTPLVTKGGKVVFGYGTIKSAQDIRLEGIVFDPGGDSIAIINGMVMKENDKLGNIKIIKIEPNKIKLLFNQTDYTIKLKE